MPEADHDHTPEHRAAPNPDRSATRDDFHEALSQARIITDIIAQLAEAAISGTAQPCGSLFAWLGDELDTRLERVEAAGNTLVWGCCA